MFARLARCALAIAFVSPATASAQSEFVLGPEAAPIIMEAVNAGPLPDDWALSGVRVEAEEVELRFERGDEAASFSLLHTDVGGACFTVSLDEDSPRPLRNAVVTRLDTLAGDCPWRVAPEFAANPEPHTDGRGTSRLLDELEREQLFNRPDVRLIPVGGVVLALFGLFCVFRRSWTERLVALLCLVMVAAWAWWVDDAFITYHYARRLLDGHGLVFNVGERVQGFTHPLWLFLVAGLGALVTPPLASLMLGGLFSAGLLFVLARAVESLDHPPLAFAAMGAVLFSSNALLTFQTSGLEGSLLHLLVVGTALSASSSRRLAPTVLLAALAMCTRLDAMLTTAPFVLWAWRRGARFDAWAALALSPLLGWLLFAAFYFGYPLPNTFYAKTGEPLFTTVVRGGLYLADYAYAEPLGALLIVGALGISARALRDAHTPNRGLVITIGAATLLHLLYVIYVGGDYMRGRFLTVLLPLSALSLSAALPLRWSRRALLPVGAVAVLGLLLLAFPRDTDHCHDERRFKPMASLWRWRFGVQYPGQARGDFVVEPVVGFDLMRDAYHADPRIVWVDGLGLTDPFVARCPALPGERAGHVTRRLPRAYFAARGDVRLHEDGAIRVRTDATLRDSVEALRAEPGWPDALLQRRYDELYTLTRGPLLAPGRMGLILRYSLSRQPIVIPPETELHDPDPEIHWGQ